MKAVIRGKCMGLTIGVRKTLQLELQEAEINLSSVQIDRAKGCIGPETERENLNKVLATRDRLETYTLKTYRQLLHREGDTPGKLLAWIIRKEEARSPVLYLKNVDGEEVRNQINIAETFRRHLQDVVVRLLRETWRSQISDFLLPLALPKITDDMRRKLEGDLTLLEIQGALDGLPAGKTSGGDGFPTEFYKAFAAKISTPLLETFNEAMDNGELPGSMREGQIVLILKKGLEGSDPSSYRPITIINSDTKILCKILAKRVRTVIQELIHEDQCGFIPNRNTTMNLRRLSHVIHETEDSLEDQAIVSIDITKAFDTVEWPYLMQTLTQMGFGPRFRAWVQLLYTKPVGRIRMAGILSDTLSISRGTRQGCPLSPLLFALAIEPMAIWTREWMDPWGIVVSERKHLISLYADDALFYLTQPMCSLPKLLEGLEKFGKVSGLKINQTKSLIFPLGALRDTPIADLPVLPIRWETESFKYLGVMVAQTPSKRLQYNIIKVLEKLGASVRFWNTLPLSVMGRVAITKMVVLPRCMYSSTRLTESPK